MLLFCLYNMLINRKSRYILCLREIENYNFTLLFANTLFLIIHMSLLASSVQFVAYSSLQFVFSMEVVEYNILRKLGFII